MTLPEEEILRVAWYSAIKFSEKYPNHLADEVVGFAWEHLTKLNRRGALNKNYMFRSGYLGILDGLRLMNKNKKDKRFLEKPQFIPVKEFYTDYEPETRPPGFEERLWAKWDEYRVLRTGLPPRTRVFLALHLLEGCSQREISRIFGISLHTVSRAIIHASEHLFRRSKEVL